MNCRYSSHSVIGQQHQYLIFVQIESVVVADACMPSGAPVDLTRVRIDPAAVDPLARLGAGFFSRITNVAKAPVGIRKPLQRSSLNGSQE